MLILFQILTVIFWVSVIWAVWAINQKDRKKKEAGKGILGLAGVIFIIAIIMGAIEGGINLFNKGSGFLSERESKKERCVNKTRNIENEFTAKKLYKACMKR